jgi:hypothetical protein
MKNKVYFVKRLCELRGLDPESDEAKAYYELKVVDLLIEIKKSTPVTETEPQDEDEEDEFPSLARRLGCT